MSGGKPYVMAIVRESSQGAENGRMPESTPCLGDNSANTCGWYERACSELALKFGFRFLSSTDKTN